MIAVKPLDDWRELRVALADGVKRFQVVAQTEEKSDAIHSSRFRLCADGLIGEEAVFQRRSGRFACRSDLKDDDLPFKLCRPGQRAICNDLLPARHREAAEKVERVGKIEWGNGSQNTLSALKRHPSHKPSDYLSRRRRAGIRRQPVD